MREKYLLQKSILKASCWKEEKNQILGDDPLPLQVKKKEAQKCDWGLQEMAPICKNCIYFRLSKIEHQDRLAISDDEINKKDIPTIALEMFKKGRNEEIEYREKAQSIMIKNNNKKEN